MDSNKIAIFQKKEICKVIYENEWWFVINDVIAALTDSADPTQYFKRMKSRDPELKILTEQGGVQVVPPPYTCVKNQVYSIGCLNIEY
jgi:DNA-damage-inducible protein D